jgi:hypothetical protein
MKEAGKTALVAGPMLNDKEKLSNVSRKLVDISGTRKWNI